ncbi:hypothetical protein PVAP13_3KG240300 [Panicum virgatum]|uniref:Uncharacterized protein n=1 Tax=Panicum virgatum TaxID=38727 RepID=A0A8T0UWQ2_PANVG|nr:hypothetical protein PVAP13_3KG240300 [Panicum virgatum]
MARLHRLSAVAPTISVLLLLSALASAVAAAAADAPVKKVGIRFVRPANKEEAQWMDRYTGSDQQLGDGPIRMRRATAEDAKWLDRMSGNAGRAGDQSGGGGGSGGGDSYIEFDDDNPYIEALRAWASQLAKRITIEDAETENPFQDL